MAVSPAEEEEEEEEEEEDAISGKKKEVGFLPKQPLLPTTVCCLFVLGS